MSLSEQPMLQYVQYIFFFIATDSPVWKILVSPVKNYECCRIQWVLSMVANPCVIKKGHTSTLQLFHQPGKTYINITSTKLLVSDQKNKNAKLVYKKVKPLFKDCR